MSQLILCFLLLATTTLASVASRCQYADSNYLDCARPCFERPVSSTNASTVATPSTSGNTFTPSTTSSTISSTTLLTSQISTPAFISSSLSTRTSLSSTTRTTSTTNPTDLPIPGGLDNATITSIVGIVVSTVIGILAVTFAILQWKRRCPDRSRLAQFRAARSIGSCFDGRGRNWDIEGGYMIA